MVEFQALIKKIEVISLVSGDKQATIHLQLNDVNVSNEILNALNSLQNPQNVVNVRIEENE